MKIKDMAILTVMLSRIPFNYRIGLYAYYLRVSYKFVYNVFYSDMLFCSITTNIHTA